MAFLFTVLGEWFAEGKSISKGERFKWICYLMNAEIVVFRYLARHGTRSIWHSSLRSFKDTTAMRATGHGMSTRFARLAPVITGELHLQMRNL
jgi:hypothetical protein